MPRMPGGAVLRSVLTAQGDIIYAAAPATPAALAAGASGYFLQSQGPGANPIYAIAGGGIVLITKKTLTSPGAIDFTDLDTTTYPMLKLCLLATCAAVASHIQVRLQGDANTRYAVDRLWVGNASQGNNQFISQTQFNVGLVGGQSDVFPTYAEITLFNPSGIDKFLQAHLQAIGSSASNMYINYTGGRYTSVTVETITRITLFPNTGNFASGAKAWLYGMTE